jgi:hypothetical protein
MPLSHMFQDYNSYKPGMLPRSFKKSILASAAALASSRRVSSETC